jgi:enamine deaminase RidA (YjgF/YER057c/UK114 family)
MTTGTDPVADEPAAGQPADNEPADRPAGGGSAVRAAGGGSAERAAGSGSTERAAGSGSSGGEAAASGGRRGSIERFGSGGPWEDVYGYSRVVRAGDLLVTAGCTATVDGQVTGVGDPHAQTLTAFRIALDALAAAGALLDDVVRTRMYVTDVDHADAAGRAHGELFGSARPAATLVVVARLLHPDHLVEVEVEAYVGGRPRIVLV